MFPSSTASMLLSAVSALSLGDCSTCSVAKFVQEMEAKIDIDAAADTTEETPSVSGSTPPVDEGEVDPLSGGYVHEYLTKYKKFTSASEWYEGLTDYRCNAVYNACYPFDLDGDSFIDESEFTSLKSFFKGYKYGFEFEKVRTL